LAVALPVQVDAQELSPEVDRDPIGVASAQQWLAHDWRRCRLANYPRDPVQGVEKVSTTLRFGRTRRKNRKVKARLQITFHKRDGKKVKMTRPQKRFVRCVKKAFGKRKFIQSGAPKGPIVVANPHPGRRFSRGGRLSHVLAQRQASVQLHKARRACRMRRVKTPMRLTLRVKRDGSATDIQVFGPSKRQRKCIKRRLRRTLRFPPIKAPVALEVP